MATAPVLQNDRVVRRTPLPEMERRWSLVRDHLGAIGAQALVALGSDDYLGGYLRWLSDRPAINAYHNVVIFHADAPMTLIEHGAINGVRSVRGNPDYPGTEQVHTTTSWRSVRNTYNHEADIVCRLIRAKGYRRVAVVGSGGMPHAFAQALVDLDIELVDVTDFIDSAKARKSAAEIAEIRATAEMQDDIFDAILTQIRPGMRDLDIAAIAQFEGRKRGSEQGVFLVSSQEIGKPTLLAIPHFQGRRFARGEHVTLLIENNGPAGYYTELGRTIMLGKAPQALLETMALVVEAQQHSLHHLRAGTACAEIAAAHDDWSRAHGIEQESRLYAHGQGYDIVERPLIRADEEGMVEAGMNIVVHPSFVADGAFGYVCDNFIVQEDGPAMPIHRTEQRIFEV